MFTDAYASLGLHELNTCTAIYFVCWVISFSRDHREHMLQIDINGHEFDTFWSFRCPIDIENRVLFIAWNKHHPQRTLSTLISACRDRVSTIICEDSLVFIYIILYQLYNMQGQPEWLPPTTNHGCNYLSTPLSQLFLVSKMRAVVYHVLRHVLTLHMSFPVAITKTKA